MALQPRDGPEDQLSLRQAGARLLPGVDFRLMSAGKVCDLVTHQGLSTLLIHQFYMKTELRHLGRSCCLVTLEALGTDGYIY
jgi:hypothetical protein